MPIDSNSFDLYQSNQRHSNIKEIATQLLSTKYPKPRPSTDQRMHIDSQENT